MRLIFVFSLLTAALAQAAEPVAAAKVSEPRPEGAVVTRPAAIPAGAVQAAPYLYRYTDREGKSWFYRETPFGVVRYPDQPEVALKSPAPVGMIASDDGDGVRFERLGPFGIYHWRRNKSELDAGEQAAWDRERARLNAKE